MSRSGPPCCFQGWCSERPHFHVIPWSLLRSQFQLPHRSLHPHLLLRPHLRPRPPERLPSTRTRARLLSVVEFSASFLLFLPPDFSGFEMAATYPMGLRTWKMSATWVKRERRNADKGHL